ncbi:hypothetical protein FB556_2038 [Enteractinococcus coprophilus]|uniref:Uncharacterized protein n=1 Tax=Enteractinococcus coprophilus TaxID=1027633 RepID=A0A543AG53_9MICC|nr:hypothetical protein FB556_2038 [Enteractinococcus coprophilus]
MLSRIMRKTHASMGNVEKLQTESKEVKKMSVNSCFGRTVVSLVSKMEAIHSRFVRDPNGTDGDAVGIRTEEHL